MEYDSARGMVTIEREYSKCIFKLEIFHFYSKPVACVAGTDQLTMAGLDRDIISWSSISRWPGAEDPGGACPSSSSSAHPRACSPSALRWETRRSCFHHVLHGNWLAPEIPSRNRNFSHFPKSWRALFTVWNVPSQAGRRLLTSSQWASLRAIPQYIPLGCVHCRVALDDPFHAAQSICYACSPCKSFIGKEKGWGDWWCRTGSNFQALLPPPPSVSTPMFVYAPFLSCSFS